MILNLNPSHVRAAQLHALPATDDGQDALKGILIAKNGDIVGTTGRTLFVATGSIPEDQRPDEDLLVRLPRMTPPIASSFMIDTDDGAIRVSGKSYGKAELLYLSYPDYKVIIKEVRKQPGKQTKYSDTVVLTAQYWRAVAQTFGDDVAIKMSSRGLNDKIVCVFNSLSKGSNGGKGVPIKDCIVVVMPRHQDAGNPKIRILKAV